MIFDVSYNLLMDVLILGSTGEFVFVFLYLFGVYLYFCGSVFDCLYFMSLLLHVSRFLFIFSYPPGIQPMNLQLSYFPMSSPPQLG